MVVKEAAAHVPVVGTVIDSFVSDSGFRKSDLVVDACGIAVGYMGTQIIEEKLGLERVVNSQ